MKVEDLKNILVMPLQIGKSFSPITEYIYFNKNIIRATNLESYLELQLFEDLPFNGCVLAEPVKKFLSSLAEDTELTFEVNQNVLIIYYGGKNKFSVPMESLESFPESPREAKYTESDFLYTSQLIPEFIENLERAFLFSSDTDTSFNGVFLKGKHIYSSNREIIYDGRSDQDFGESRFIPKNLIKFLLKFKDSFVEGNINFYKTGFSLVNKEQSIFLFFPNYNSNICPDFEKVLGQYKNEFLLTSDGLSSAVNRVKIFDSVVSIDFKENYFTLYTNAIKEYIPYSFPEDKTFSSVKCNTQYLKMILDMCDHLIFYVVPEKDGIQAFGGETDKYKIVAARIG